MLLSIVTGTFNRLPLLQQMIVSVRRSLYHGLQYEFVIVDGGSNDGTIEWCKTQVDIRLIAHGGLFGAVRAFTDGALDARGDYVLLANDDVAFVDTSILRAIAYLETNPTAGAVAFADDRPAQGKPPGFGVQTQTYLTRERPNVPNPRIHQATGLWETHKPYAQVGLFRRWLGDVCGWWGADDALFVSHTYGGDNYLSARIAEYGYTVDAVEGVRVRDLVAKDGLREHNVTREDTLTKGGGGYYARFPQPPLLLPAPAFDHPASDDGRLRLLYLPIFETGSYPHHPVQKRGLREALNKIGHTVEVDYLNQPYDLCELVRNWQPDILLTQCQRDKIDLTEARNLCPNMLVLNWNGDVYLDALIDADSMEWMRRNVDMQLTVNAAALPHYTAGGVKAAYWQCGWEPVNEELEVENRPDIVFMGSAYSPPWLTPGMLPPRFELVNLLTGMSDSHGYEVLLIGTGWVNYPDHNGGNTTYDFELSNAIRRASKIEVGDNQWMTDTGFVSNRMFECLRAGGALLLHQVVPELERYTGLVAGKHYVEWTDYDDLREKLKYWLDKKQDKKRRELVRNAQAYVMAHHSFDARVKQLFHEILPGVLG